jgi:glucosyl-3-phosphoglycerate synthase
MKKVVVVFPARNEGKTIAKCVEVAKQSRFQPQVIVVDGHSTDNTRKEARLASATVVQQSRGIYPAKGRAIKDGVKAALKAQAEVITFLDADIVNLTPDWIDLLVEPVVEDKYDMTRGYYRRAEYDGAVTKLIAKPLSWVFFPEIAHFNQPLSGEICANATLFRDVMKGHSCPEGWGIDIWILIESAMKDYRIKEIYLGTKIHTSRQDYFEDVVKLAKMAEQVSLTTVKEAIKFRRIGNVKRVSL